MKILQELIYGSEPILHMGIILQGLDVVKFFTLVSKVNVTDSRSSM